MTDMQPKKMIILDILEILRKHTDENDKKTQTVAAADTEPAGKRIWNES
ncbi:MAG: hypothetical protein PUA84_04650 [Oscillospiraceae bacterium]|nr:hypothetical protein [Oscillospiraceae bacterium]